ncbi:MAG: FliA/WhiG family RNA polymerase sigma factor [Thermodesulfobacteriota bacterium]|nr:FliA/WhiG family RNA polymerase sigma factor [Deltaproteobacteria bacterium]MBZ0219277.1 FliA/WhiG family RNA polymerase sigma factor [Deltaproteobacteria bacterium]MCL4872464.1 FliA/WhiG family RNA polymerase sigma factor [bacterium]WKZ31849.1 MAG: FliA/WhiG family RNA polymerase sigma factor [Thermodesulfobacteriota bacterium]
MTTMQNVKTERDRLLEENIHLVKIIAYQVAVNLPPHIDVNDLISAGTIGLLESIDRFDSAKGVQFNTYASIRIRGAIMDELRSMDWMTRSMRDKSNQLEKAYDQIERKTGRPAETEEVARFLEISTDELNSMLSQVSAVSVLNLEDLGMSHDEGMNILECIKDPDGTDPMQLIKLEQIKKKVAEAVETLPDKEKLIISLYYYDELTLKEIGKVLDITESRVCQLHSQTMHRLKGRLKRTL